MDYGLKACRNLQRYGNKAERDAFLTIESSQFEKTLSDWMDALVCN